MEKSKFLLNKISLNSTESVPLLNVNYDTVTTKWVDYGQRDLMPYRLIELYNQSGFHSSIIKSKVNLIMADGIEQDIENDDEYSENTQKFIDKANQYESMDSVLKKVSFDFEIFGLAYLEIIYSNDRLTISEINHIDATKIRWGKKVKGHLTHVFYSENWKLKSKKIPKPIPIFNPALKDEYPIQILPIIKYSPDIQYYTLPTYYSSIKWIEIDFQISNFHENNIKNGLMPTVFFGFPNGTPTEEEMEQIESSLKKKLGGTNNAGSFITAFYEPGNEVQIQVLDITNASEQYQWLLEATQQQILIGAQVNDQQLVGISTAGKLGSINEVIQANELFYNNVIKHEQNDILNQLNKIMRYNGMNDVRFAKDSMISKEFSENTLVQVLDKNELREIIGYSPIEQVVSGSTNMAKCECGHFHELSHKHIALSNLETNDIFEIDNKTYKFEAGYINSNTSLSEIKKLDQNQIYLWTLGKGTKEGPKKGENCPACVKHSGDMRSLKQWMQIAIPGKSGNEIKGSDFAVGKYGTYCEQHCTCRLNLIDTTEDDGDTFKKIIIK